MVNKQALTLLRWRPWGHREVLRQWWRPTARCKPEKEPRYMWKNWTYHGIYVKELVGKLCEDHGKTYHWTSGRKPHLTQIGKRIDCNISNYAPFVVPGISTSSSTTPTHLLLQHLHHRILYFDVRRYAENPVPERSGSTSEELRGIPLHRSTKTKNTQNGERQEQEFR